MVEIVVAAVGARTARSTESVIGVLRRGVEDLVQRSVGIELTWSTSGVTRGDDLGSAERAVTTDGLDWRWLSRRLGADRPESVTLSAQFTVMRDAHLADPDPERYDPRMYVAEVSARFPAEVPWATAPVGGLRVRAAMSRWALYGGGEQLDWLQGQLRGWSVSAADALDADTGYAGVEDTGLSDDRSRLEVDRELIPSYRDFSRWLWGAGWGTLLGPAHLAAVGGPAGLRDLGATAQDLSGGRVWFELGPDPAAAPPDRLEALVRLLEPAIRGSDDRPAGAVERRPVE